MDFIKSQQYIAEHRAETINDICRFLDADTLLFWDENEDLSVYQTKYW
jgi:chaperone required for assembly of F1-ATPase